ncbi:MAG TPA: PqqD family protein [Dysgonamonadaceae bacterium]|nr:PqqD family protein [Dysgonamonadaceae bacterium]
MKLKENLSVRKIGDDYMMVSDSSAGLDYTRVISLNETAAYLVEEVGKREFTKDEWIELLMNKYDVEREVAEADVQLLIDKFVKEGLFEE